MEHLKKERPELLKTLKVSPETHQKVKIYCKENDFYISKFLDHILGIYIDNQTKQH
jgi:hypothetical protein